MQLQRSFRVVVVLFAVLFSQSAFSAQAGTASQNSFWEKVRGLVQQCSVQTFTVENGKKVDGPLRSNCAELQATGSEARFKLDGEWYSASIADSSDADGGDLNDVLVQDQNGSSVATRHNTLAFGDILVGLAGGQVQLPQDDQNVR